MFVGRKESVGRREEILAGIPYGRGSHGSGTPVEGLALDEKRRGDGLEKRKEWTSETF